MSRKATADELRTIEELVSKGAHADLATRQQVYGPGSVGYLAQALKSKRPEVYRAVKASLQPQRAPQPTPKPAEQQKPQGTITFEQLRESAERTMRMCEAASGK